MSLNLKRESVSLMARMLYLSPTSAAHVCTSDKRVEADCHLT